MAISYTRMTRKGQITVPATVRAALDLKEGDRIEIEVGEEGEPTASLRRADSVVERTRGSLPGPVGRLITTEEMRRSFVE